MSQSHQFKGGAADEAFQEQCFLWERGAPVGMNFGLWSSTQKENLKKKKHNRSPPNYMRSSDCQELYKSKHWDYRLLWPKIEAIITCFESWLLRNRAVSKLSFLTTGLNESHEQQALKKRKQPANSARKDAYGWHMLKWEWNCGVNWKRTYGRDFRKAL